MELNELTEQIIGSAIEVRRLANELPELIVILFDYLAAAVILRSANPRSAKA